MRVRKRDEASTMTELRIGYLYPTVMNLYGDLGNIRCLQDRCLRRGIEASVTEIGLGDPIDPEEYDLYFVGGGQDREQIKVADDLASPKGEALRDAVAAGAVVLAVCGGFQLLGRFYRPSVGPDLPGLGIFDLWTVHPGPTAARCIGNLSVKWNRETLVGFENHGGRTHLGAGVRALASVLHGHGNNAEDGTEGAVYRNAYGTYLHGPLLPKNPHFADHLIRLALVHAGSPQQLTPLNDELEWRAHHAALALARRETWARRIGLKFLVS
jgi:CobQ-like glutamine amidotransferase family enzyme